jgi:hypothetical protein
MRIKISDRLRLGIESEAVFVEQSKLFNRYSYWPNHGKLYFCQSWIGTTTKVILW